MRASGIVVHNKGQSAPPHPVRLLAGHPFVFLVREAVNGSFLFMGAEHPRSLLVLEGKTKTVIYGARMEAGDLRISIYLDPWYESADYRDLEIPPEMIAEADELVASFALLP